MAALGPTPFNNLLAVCCAHALQEPVAGFSLALVWLVCSLHGARSLWFGEAGILCLMEFIVKHLIVGVVSSSVHVLGWDVARVVLGLAFARHWVENGWCASLTPHRFPALWLPSRRSAQGWCGAPALHTGGGWSVSFSGEELVNVCVRFLGVLAVVN
jgi:hypothetical protein